MTPAVSELHVAGDTGSKLVDGGEGAPVEGFLCEDGPETLRTGVVISAARRTHEANQTVGVALLR
jgi:hypothetical protein